MKSKRIVIADDQSGPRHILKDALVEKGFDVIGEASNGREVIELNERLKPDIIIMDVKMPEMSGIDASRAISLKSSVPVILLTVRDDPHTVELARDAGVMGYMVKPLNKKELLPTIEIAFARFNECKTVRKENSDLRETAENRKVIEKAKGVLMDKSHIKEKDAFRKIQKLSMDRNIPMKEVAKSIILASEL